MFCRLLKPKNLLMLFIIIVMGLLCFQCAKKKRKKISSLILTLLCSRCLCPSHTASQDSCHFTALTQAKVYQLYHIKQKLINSGKNLSYLYPFCKKGKEAPRSITDLSPHAISYRSNAITNSPKLLQLLNYRA